jgi:hypothetical protein
MTRQFARPRRARYKGPGGVNLALLPRKRPAAAAGLGPRVLSLRSSGFAGAGGGTQASQ